MEEQHSRPAEEDALSPAAYVARMRERTDKNGLLSIPEGNFADGTSDVDETAERVFEMDWDPEKLQDLYRTLEDLFPDIREIACIGLDVCCDPVHDAYIPGLEAGRLYDVWRTYIRRYDFSELRPDAVRAVEKSMLAKMGAAELTVREKHLCARYLYAYLNAVEEEAAERLGGGPFDVAVIFRARRVCTLYRLHAPELILQHEEQRLAEALALTRFAKREIRG